MEVFMNELEKKVIEIVFSKKYHDSEKNYYLRELVDEGDLKDLYIIKRMVSNLNRSYSTVANYAQIKIDYLTK